MRLSVGQVTENSNFDPPSDQLFTWRRMLDGKQAVEEYMSDF